MKTKKTILVFIGYYLPGYKGGGSLRTIANMVVQLGDDFNFKIITRDRDWGDEKPYPNVKVNWWNSGNNCKIYYVDNSTKISSVIKNCEFDQYYLNSFFDYNFSIKIILLKKLGLIPNKQIILAPRGEFMQGALAAKTLKKKLFIKISNLFELYKEVIWHASTEDEALEIKREMGTKINYKTALNLPDYTLLEKSKKINTTRKEKSLRILYLSNIVPKKNLKFAIQVLNEIKGDFIFDIYGSIINAEYWNDCLNTIEPAVKNKILYKGEIPNEDITNIYTAYDVLFLPTHGENFGHVIWESLALGCRVLTTDKTPWNNLEEFNLGWNIPLSEFDKFVKVCNDLTINLTNSLSKKWPYFNNYINKNMQKLRLLKDNRNLFSKYTY